MEKIVKLLRGKKTYIVAVLAIGLSIAGNYIEIPDWVFQLLLGTGALTLRDAISNIKRDSKAIIDATDKK